MNLKGFIQEVFKQVLNENNNKTLSCVPIKLTNEIISEVKKFKTAEDLLRSGGLSTSTLDRAAFGFSAEDIKTLMPRQLKVKWNDDLEGVKHEIEFLRKHSGGNSLSNVMKIWASGVDLKNPIDVSYEKNAFYIEDGHHRFYAAKILNKPLNINLEIKMNPIVKLAPSLSYDDFHRCVFNQVEALL